ncbi:MAG: DUF4159 domain-containing protein [Phycisphaeraceae bacterium]
MKRKTTWILIALIATAASLVFAQRSRFRSEIDEQTYSRSGITMWKNPPAFRHDTFTFARVIFSGYGRGGGWATDYPDSDINFSFRLQQLTSLKVNPIPVKFELTDPALFDYPWIYMIEPGGLYFSEPEVKALRKYLLNGGFMMVDDFWGGDEYDNFHQQIKRVFPDRQVVDLPLEHPIFHCVYDLKKKPQVPSIGHGANGQTSEWRPGPDDGSEVHYRAIFDDKGRMMMIICHNTDLGDGWEREGENEHYFKEFSEKQAYPMGINIVFYAMTH